MLGGFVSHANGAQRWPKRGGAAATAAFRLDSQQSYTLSRSCAEARTRREDLDLLQKCLRALKR